MNDETTTTTPEVFGPNGEELLTPAQVATANRRRRLLGLGRPTGTRRAR